MSIEAAMIWDHKHGDPGHLDVIAVHDLPVEGDLRAIEDAAVSSYYHHFSMGLIGPDGTPKLALEHFRAHTHAMGIMQWFHFEDPRLDDAVAWRKTLGVADLRTRPRWTDSYRPGRNPGSIARWTRSRILRPSSPSASRPNPRALPHHTSPPKDPMYFADSCARMIERYTPAQPCKAVA